MGDEVAEGELDQEDAGLDRSNRRSFLFFVFSLSTWPAAAGFLIFLFRVHHSRNK